MRIRFLIFFLINVIFLQSHAQDLIIYRDGRVKQVRIIQTNNDKTLFKEWGDKHAAEEFVDNTKVFMLKFKTRGNVVFNGKGERILTTSDPVQIPKDAIVVYYKDGREVPAYNLTMDANMLSFRTSKSDKKRGGILGKKSGKAGEGDRPVYSPRTDVFMISYPDGTRDILTDLAAEEESSRLREAEAARLAAQREAARADSIAAAAAEDERTASVANPRKATIVTKAGARLKVWVCGDTQSAVSYKKVNTPKAAIFKMSKAKVKNIIY